MRFASYKTWKVGTAEEAFLPVVSGVLKMPKLAASISGIYERRSTGSYR
jgi:hypothetical protein